MIFKCHFISEWEWPLCNHYLIWSCVLEYRKIVSCSSDSWFLSISLLQTRSSVCSQYLIGIKHGGNYISYISLYLSSISSQIGSLEAKHEWGWSIAWQENQSVIELRDGRKTSRLRKFPELAPSSNSISCHGSLRSNLASCLCRWKLRKVLIGSLRSLLDVSSILCAKGIFRTLRFNKLLLYSLWYQRCAIICPGGDVDIKHLMFMRQGKPSNIYHVLKDYCFWM